MAGWTRLLWFIVAWVLWWWISLVHIGPYLTLTQTHSYFLVPKLQAESDVKAKEAEAAATSQTSVWKRSRTNEDWNRFLDGANNSTPNILILITDQMRKPRRRRRGGQDDWIADQLHVTQRLMKHGLTFENAMVAASPCSPSRAALWTGTYPQANGVLDVVSSMTPPWKQLRPRNQKGGFATLGNLFQDAHYETVYKGKWHLHNPLLPNSESLTDFGFNKWNPPDNPYYLSEAKNYDRRYAISDDTYESAVDYLKDWSNRLAHYENKKDKDASSGGGEESPKPFFTVVSLVNPHDITYFLGKWADILPGGYNSTEVERMTGSLRAPVNANEFIRPPNHAGRYNKPSVQHYYQPPWTREQRDQYAQFYAYLNHYIEKPGGDLDAVVNALSKEALDRTLIVRFSDHGEMGMSHGLLEKMSVAYEEVLNVPLVVSNPIAFPNNKNNNNNEPVSQSKSSSSQRLVSLVDLMPTLCTLAGLRVPSSAVGVDFSSTVMEQEDDNDMFVADDDEDDKKNKKYPSNENAVIFTNDYPSRNTSMYLPDLIRCIRTGHDYKGAPNHKYAVYFKPGSTYFQFELYDLNTDPNENTNLLANDDDNNDGNILPRNASAHSQFLIWNLLHTDLTA
eukprot:CAMPEP_0198300828 /NCGR_PEP_ID=MMETSP1449-20131203/49617_1 /TAXON_ID=420275 /ORGANISM="Attheya septentrionalis, Strain CCMP2084" /LENGTH=620 /DNA_ID=CAMNT_0044002753 /DNA_START=174 /DNA_END=2033 /DNA_ORIENTATION=+